MLSRSRARPAAEARAFLRWRQATTGIIATTTTVSAAGPLLPEQQGTLPDCNGTPDEGVATAEVPLRGEVAVAAAKAAKAAARAEADALARRHAVALEQSR